jgi:hypothetical protein
MKPPFKTGHVCSKEQYDEMIACIAEKKARLDKEKPRLYLFDYKYNNNEKNWAVCTEWMTKEEARRTWTTTSTYRISPLCPEGIDFT